MGESEGRIRGVSELLRGGAAHGGEDVVDGFPEFYFISFLIHDVYKLPVVIRCNIVEDGDAVAF